MSGWCKISRFILAELFWRGVFCRFLLNTFKLSSGARSKSSRQFVSHRVIGFLLLLGGATNVYATMAVSPSPSYNGSYTVNWATCCYGTFILDESLDGGATWSAVYSAGSNTGSKSFSGKPLGTYTYKLIWHDVDDPDPGHWLPHGGPVSVQVKVPDVPGTPTGPNADGPNGEGYDSDGSYTISWTSVPGVTSYQLQEQLGTGAWSTIYTGTTLSKARSALADGQWHYRVKACDSLGCSGFSGTYKVYVARAPGVPASISVNPQTSTNLSHTVSWNASTGTVSSYTLQQNDGSGWNTTNPAYTGTNTSVTLNNLNPGSYLYRVEACNTVGTYTNCSGWQTLAAWVTVVQPPCFYISDAQAVTEGGVASFTIYKSGTGSVDYSVNYSTADGSAAAGSDYTAASGTATLTSTQTSQTITVSTINDTIYESAETFVVNLSASGDGSTVCSGGPTQDGQGSATINPDGDAPPSFRIDNAQNVEGQGIVFTVTMTGSSDLTHQVHFSTIPGTAGESTDPGSADYDYVHTEGDLTFSPGGPTQQTVTVQTLNEIGAPVFEHNEAFTVELSAPTNGATLESEYQGTGTIIDDDPAPSFIVDPADVDEDAGTVNVWINGSTEVDMTIEFETIVDVDDTATEGTDFTYKHAVLSFGPTSGSAAQSVPVDIIPDNVYEGNETFTARIYNPSDNAPIEGDGKAKVTINDDNDKPSFTVDDVSVAEGNSGQTAITFHVTENGLSNFTHDVSYGTVDGSATVADNDYASTSGTLSFPPTADGISTHELAVTVYADGDATIEPDEAFSLVLSAPTNGAYIADADGVGTIQNDDFAPELPSSINVTPTGSDSVTVDWGAAGGTIPVTRYELEEGVDGGAFSNVYSGMSLTDSLSGLAAAIYAYRVRACNDSGCGEWLQANPVVVAPPPTDPAGLFTVGTNTSGYVPGSTPGQFSVDASGAAGYVIPIAVPPGTAGMQPALKFSYSSHSGNALLGVGWTLGGLSVITRCPQTTAQDGQIRGIDFSNNDRFCIDGQRLVAINGTYGANGTEYRTEVDGFTKVVSYGTAGSGPQEFKVWTKSGQVLEYGYTADSRIEALGRSDVRLWAVNKVEDTAGNYLTVTYYEDGTTGEYRPTEIDYAGNDGSNPVLQPYASVQFTYENRTDIATLFLAGSMVQNTQRLTHVKTFVDGGMVKDYQLSYDNNGIAGESRLTQIQECAGPDTCLPPTQFTWAGNGSLPVYNNQIATLANGSSYNFYTGDWNGDGRTDIFLQDKKDGISKMYLANSNGTMTVQSFQPAGWGFNEDSSTTYRSMFTGDWNGDGKTDIGIDTITISSGTPPDFTFSHSISLYLSNGTTFIANGQSPIAFTSHYYQLLPMIAVGDWNGDGRSDMAFIVMSPDVGAMYLSDASGNGHMNYVGTAPGWGNNPGDFTVGDWNGDGRTDLAVNTVLYVSTGSAFTVSAALVGCTGNCKLIPGDFNGDGYTDVILKAVNSDPQTPEPSFLFFAKGDGTFVQSNTSFPDWGDKEAKVGDWNGDGKADIVRSNGDLFISNGSTLVNTGQNPILAGDVLSAGDWNGDGMSDLWVKPSTESESATEYKTTHSGFDALSSIQNGLGATTVITYKPLTDSSVYTKGSSAAYPNIDVQAAIYVVSSILTDNGVGGQGQTTYTYSGAQVDVSGRGFLGFGSMDSVDVDTNIKTDNTYRQDFPYIGLVAETQQYHASTLLSDVTSSYAEKTTGNAHFPYASHVVKKDYEVSTALLVTTTTTDIVYDNYGNPTSITVGTTGGGGTYTTETVNSYLNDTGNWYLGRLVCAAVTQTMPDTSSATRTSGFEYDGSTGILTREVVEPKSANIDEQGLPDCVTTVSPSDPSYATLTLTTDYGHDSYGNRTTVTVSGDGINPRTTTTSYDTQGRFPATVENALGHAETHTWDNRFGVPATVTGPNDLTTQWEYDDFGRQEAEWRADGTSTQVQRVWCTAGSCPGNGVLKVITTTPGAAATVLVTDKLGREIEKGTVGFDRRVIQEDTVYNSIGEVSQKSLPYFAGDTVYWHVMTYDVVGRLQQDTAPDGGITTTAYNGLTTSITNAASQTTMHMNNALGKLAQVTDAQAHVTQYSYDPFGDLVQVVADVGGQNVTITNSYDRRGRKTGMDDPDMGQWSYHYDALGQLVSQTDAKGQTVTLDYDLLGRMVSRTEAEGTSTWVYDYDSGAGQDYAAGQTGHSIGKLVNVTGAEGDHHTYNYDAYGRPETTTTWLDDNGNGVQDAGEVYVTGQGYDFLGRMTSTIYPASAHDPLGLTVKRAYTVDGYLKSLRDGDSNALYWQADARDVAGQLKQATYGNGIVTNWGYNETTGLIHTIESSTPLHLGENDVQNTQYDFDYLGNLTERQDLRKGLSETFSYDTLNRLTQVDLADGINPVQTTTESYDALGNIASKSDIDNNYRYGENQCHVQAGPHAVTTAGGQHFCYDSNGNQTQGFNFTLRHRTFITWTSYNKPQSIHLDHGAMLTFAYGADRSRFKQTNDTTGVTTFYIGGGYEKQVSGTTVTHVHYIAADGLPIAIVKSVGTNVSPSNPLGDPQGPEPSVRYLHRDHIGSVTEITDEAASIVEEASYDAWGKRRHSTDWSPANSNEQLTLLETLRGFTNHEMLDDVGLIHMNGRVYDPELGRFLSADPTVQFPENMQDLNRYSYVLNNPLSYTDPSGFGLFGFVADIFKGIFDIGKAFWDFTMWQFKTIAQTPILRTVAVLVAGYVCGPLCAAAESAILTAASGGSIDDIFKSAVIAAVASYNFGSGLDWSSAGVDTAVSSTAQNAIDAAYVAGEVYNDDRTIFGDTSHNSGQSKYMVMVASTGGMNDAYGGKKFENGALSPTYSSIFTGVESQDWPYSINGIPQTTVEYYGEWNRAWIIDVAGSLLTAIEALRNGSIRYDRDILPEGIKDSGYFRYRTADEVRVEYHKYWKQKVLIEKYGPGLGQVRILGNIGDPYDVHWGLDRAHGQILKRVFQIEHCSPELGCSSPIEITIP